MTYHDILVHVDNARACPARIRSAVALAELHGAGLHGCCVIPPPNLALYGEGAVVGDLLQELFQAVEADLTAAEAHFQAATADSGLRTTCTTLQGEPGRVLAEAARNVDLTVVGQPDDEDPRCTSTGVAVAVAFGAGGAVLIHPHQGDFEALGRRVLIAWDPSREAQRAVNEAMPVLERAEHVEVLTVLPDEASSLPGDRIARPVVERLARRGIEVHAKEISALDDSAGEVILERCTDIAADLLVLGAYGHSRLREFLLGGVTRRVLQDHGVPVLLAH